MESMTYRAAIFDMDGLLIDSERTIMRAWIDAAAAIGITLRAEAYTTVIGMAEPESDAILTRVLGGPAAFSAIRSRAIDLLSPEDKAVVFPLKAGAAELLGSLQAAGVVCGVASSSRAAEIRQRLQDVGIIHYFAAIAGGDEVPFGKPDPAVYKLAASRLGVPTSVCLVFEDSENGALAALASGAQVVLIPDLRAPSEAVMGRSLRVLGSLHDAIGQVPHWFSHSRR